MRKNFYLIIGLVLIIILSWSTVFAEVGDKYIDGLTGFGNKPIEVQIPGSTDIIVKTISGISTNDQIKNGDFFDLVVAQDVVINDLVVIKSGAKALGVVTMIKQRSVGGVPAELTFQILYVNTIDNQTIPMYGVFTQEGRNKSKIAGLMALPILIYSIINNDETSRYLGLLGSIAIKSIRGGDAYIPAGTEVKAITLSSTVIKVPQDVADRI